MSRRYPSRVRIERLLSGLLFLTACGMDEPLIRTTAPPTPPVVMMGQELTLREDFDNRENIDSISTALIDTNRGILTLAAEAFPEPSQDALSNSTFKGEQRHDGVVEALDVFVERDAVLDVPDALELRAEGNVIVEGTIVAGLGGVTIVAGEDVVIEGAIDSRGPIRILTRSRESEIRIVGALTTRAVEANNASAPHIEIWGRGSLRVEGVIESLAHESMVGGDIDLRVYGVVHLAAGATLSSQGRGGATAGLVRIQSETQVRLDSRARIGPFATMTWPNDDYGSAGQGIDIQAPSIQLEDHVEIRAGQGSLKGGDVLLVATEEIQIGDFALLESGAGLEGGELTLRGGNIILGNESTLRAGDSEGVAPLLRLEAADSMTTAFGSRVEGSNTACGPGGDIRIRVGGNIELNERVRFIGGAGSRNFSEGGCTMQDSGGGVYVEAQRANGIEVAAQAGLPDGSVDFKIDPSVTVDVPNPTVGTQGEVRSKIIDRGEAGVDFVPLLVDSGLLMPDDTSIAIELAGAESPEGPFDQWVQANADPLSLEPLAPFQFLRYRVRLSGRVFDAPVLDHFEILLAE